MSTKFKDFTLENSPSNSNLFVISCDEFNLDGEQFKRCSDGKWSYEISMQFIPGDHPKLSDCICVMIRKSQNDDWQIIDHIMDADTESLLPFFKKRFQYINNPNTILSMAELIFDVRILRVDPEKGVTVRVEIKDNINIKNYIGEYQGL